MKNIILLILLWLSLAAIHPPQTPTEPKPDDGFILVHGTKKGQDYPFTEKNIPVTIKSFYIAPTEVTYAQIALYCYDNKLPPKTFHREEWGAEEANRAAVNINWFDAIRYCNWLSEQTGYINKAYDIYAIVDGAERIISPKDSLVYFKKDADWSKVVYDTTSKAYRLPAQSEWEYAASSYSESKLRKKQIYAGTDKESELQHYAWYYPNSGSQAQKVKTRRPNLLDIYDMSGNVWEWCFDVSEPKTTYETLVNVHNIEAYQRLRGGCWGDNISFRCKVEFRIKNKLNVRASNYGFRLTRTP